jgi:hypothetical protein
MRMESSFKWHFSKSSTMLQSERAFVFDSDDEFRFFFLNRDDHLRVGTAVRCSGSVKSISGTGIGLSVGERGLKAIR